MRYKKLIVKHLKTLLLEIAIRLLIGFIHTKLKQFDISIPKEVLSYIINPKTLRFTLSILVKMLRFVCRIAYKQYRYLLMIWKTKKNRIK